MIRKNRTDFFGSTGTSYSKFSTSNKPTQSRFLELFRSILFPNEADDTAKESEAGHAKVSTDANAILKADDNGDGHTRFVLPHQLPGVASDGGTEPSSGAFVTEQGLTVTGATKSLGGGLTRLIYKIKAAVSKSIVINADNIELDGDAASPSDGYFYGKMGGAKGWHIPPSASGKTQLASRYTSAVMASASATPLVVYQTTVDTGVHMLNVGSTMEIELQMSRGTSANARSFFVEIGSSASYGGVGNQLLASMSFLATETTDDKYLVKIRLVRSGASSLGWVAVVDNLSLKPIESECTHPYSTASFTWPATMYVSVFGQDAAIASQTMDYMVVYSNIV